MANGNAALHSNTTGNDSAGAGCETLYSEYNRQREYRERAPGALF